MAGLQTYSKEQFFNVVDICYVVRFKLKGLLSLSNTINILLFRITLFAIKTHNFNNVLVVSNSTTTKYGRGHTCSFPWEMILH